MAEKPPEEGYISVVDEEPEIFELLKWDHSHSQKHHQQDLQPKDKEVPMCQEKRSRGPDDPFELIEPAFMKAYRLTKELARSLCEEIKPVMPESTKSFDISVENKLLATLAFYATGKHQKCIGGKSDPNNSQHFVSTAVQQITEALNHYSIVKKYIHFPHLKNERDIVKTRFYIKYGMPNVLGCIDCTHVPLVTSPDHSDYKTHFNKSFHSKKLQIICDSDLNIISVDARSGGAMSHDAILNKHVVKIDLESLNQVGEECWLIGGPNYMQKPYIMTPIPKITKKSPVSPDKYYATIHSQTHSAVLDTIKHLKTRWKCLQATCSKNFDSSTVSMIAVACCVLHNICNRNGIPVSPMTQAEERLEAMKQKVANTPISKKAIVDENGVRARTRLMNRLWSERRVAPECGTKKRTKKDRLLEYQNHPQNTNPQPQPQQNQLHQMHQPQNMQLQPTQHQTHQLHPDDASKRPRILMNTPTYALPPGWGHYPQHL